jgi:hypothetical protein
VREMAEKPILFNTEMVKAILEGRKTTTRRLLKQPFEVHPNGYITKPRGNERLCPYEPPYKVGDTLWVRETWNSDWCDHTIYKADGGSAKAAGYSKEPKWHPSIHMPREAARLFLKVTDVKVERLQDIKCQGIKDEGVLWRDSSNPNSPDINAHDAMKLLWDSTVKDEQKKWAANPWVWVIEFERIR